VFLGAGLLLVLALRFGGSPGTTSSTITNQQLSQEQTPRQLMPQEVAQPRAEPSGPEQVFGQIMRQAMLEHQREKQRRATHPILGLDICYQCGGAGIYRYVGGNGQLVANACPSCNGTGRPGGSLFGN
jgi:hypothetical protein